jgi:CTP:molybdopterin cytidylyltransferase MocA
VLLAAGRATRFGGEKLLALVGGRPVAGHAAAALSRAAELGTLQGCHAVVRERGTPLAALLEAEGLALVEAPDAERGIAHSLRAGFAALERAAPAGPAAALVVLADQPDIAPDTIAALVARWRATGAKAVRPRYSAEPDVPGHPVLVDRALWSLVPQLEGDEGLGAMLRSGQVAVDIVPVEGRNPDIDTRAELAARDTPQETHRCD